jgi:hypothetical protein
MRQLYNGPNKFNDSDLINKDGFYFFILMDLSIIDTITKSYYHIYDRRCESEPP